MFKLENKLMAFGVLMRKKTRDKILNRCSEKNALRMDEGVNV